MQASIAVVAEAEVESGGREVKIETMQRLLIVFVWLIWMAIVLSVVGFGLWHFISKVW